MSTTFQPPVAAPHTRNTLDARRDPTTGRFLTGNNGSGGRRRGSRSKLGEAFVADVQALWEREGIKALEAMLAKSPARFVELVGRLLPDQLEMKAESPFAWMTTDELRAFADDLKRWREAMDGTARSGPNGTDAQGGSNEARASASLLTLPPIPTKEEVARAWAAAD